MNVKKQCTFVLVACLVCIMSACSFSSSKAFTFHVETGDDIKVELDTSSGLSLMQKDGRFTVKEDDQTILQGIFIHEEGYRSYLAIKGKQGMRVVVEDTEKDGNVYYMYEIEGESGLEDNFVMWIKDSKTGLIMASLAGQDKAQEAFQKLTITKQ